MRHRQNNDGTDQPHLNLSRRFKPTDIIGQIDCLMIDLLDDIIISLIYYQ